MMSSKKKTLLLSGIFSLFVILTLSVVSAETDSSKTVMKQRPPVAFTHDTHMGQYECLVCHHRYEDGENVLDEDELTDVEPDETIMLNVISTDELSNVKCASCHTKNKDKAKIDSREAFHRQCIGCHDKLSTGPVLCGECHIRSNQASADE
ncbi:MAG: cytochrome c family protein [Proteobacteria bacterium]|nr:cytochrome c family protein [Pseudomonadota bacterium]